MIDSEKIKELFPDYLDRCNRKYYIINKEYFYFSKEDALEYLNELLQEYSTDFINIECCDAQDRWDYSSVLAKVPEDFSRRSEVIANLEKMAGNEPVIAYYFYDENLNGDCVSEGTFYAFESQEHLDLFVKEQSYSSHNVVIQVQ